MINELDEIVLISDLPKAGLVAGDIGTVVMIYGENKGYEVEFMTLDGDTIAVETLYPHQIRAIKGNEVAHARELVLA